MSAILAVCGDAFCAMVSDGRFVEEPITGDKPHIISDELPKVRKVNRNVLVGFAGDTLAAVQIINALDEYDVRYLTLEKVVKILCEKAPAVTTQPVGVRLLVGGRNRKGQFVLTTLALPTTTSQRPSLPGRGPILSRARRPTPRSRPGWSAKSSPKPPTGAAWTMQPTRWTPALPRWPRTTRALIPTISAS